MRDTRLAFRITFSTAGGVPLIEISANCTPHSIPLLMNITEASTLICSLTISAELKAAPKNIACVRSTSACDKGDIVLVRGANHHILRGHAISPAYTVFTLAATSTFYSEEA